MAANSMLPVMLYIALVVLLCAAPPAAAQAPPNGTNPSIFSPTSPAITFPLNAGWYRNIRMWYHDFGGNSQNNGQGIPTLNPLHVLVSAADGNPIAGQGNIAQTVPGNATYSDLWALVLHEVPANYTANTIKDYTTLQAMYPNQPAVLKGMSLNLTGKFVNCPVVPRNSVLSGCPSLQDARCLGKCCGTYTEGWWNGLPLPYFDYGIAYDVSIPLFILTSDGTPTGKVQPNTGDVVPFLPTYLNPAYTAFWLIELVNVGTTYPHDTVCNISIIESRFAAVTTTPGLIVNCPVISVDNTIQCLAAPPPPPNVPAGPASPSQAATPLAQSLVALAIIALALGA